MTVRIRALCALVLISCRSPPSARIGEARADERAPASPGVALVELFTSEGCSSCPPAEAVLQELADAGRTDGPRVFTLEFHVDYWDALGWPDRFAAPQFGARQREYARSFRESGVYTPEMIVGGDEHFVGSDRVRARESVARSIARPEALPLALNVGRRDADTLLVHYELLGALPREAFIAVAVFEPSVVVRVGAGENAGMTLHHSHVVRAFARSALRESSGAEIVRVPAALRGVDAEVVAFIQRGPGEVGAMAVLGAAQAHVPRG
jgi:hypothetical protein